MAQALTEHKRCTLSAIVMAVGLFLLLPVSVLLIAVVFYIRYNVDDELQLIQGMSTTTLPTFLAVTGIINALSQWLLLSCMASAHRPSTRAQVMTLALVAMIIAVLATLLVLATSIFCFVQLSTLPQLFQGGLGRALRQYNSVPHVKERLDMLQMEYACCGDNSFKDWFDVPWVARDVLVISTQDLPIRNLEDELYTNDDVPFSCCSPNAARPCIHHHVTSNRLHYHYDHHENTTLHHGGCRRSLMDFYGHSLLRPLAITLLFMFLCQVVVLVIARLALSSMQSALEAGHPTDPAQPFFFRKPKHPEKDSQTEEGGGERWSLLKPDTVREGGGGGRGSWSDAPFSPSPDRTGPRWNGPSSAPNDRHPEADHMDGQASPFPDVFEPGDSDPEPTPPPDTGGEPIYENVYAEKIYDDLDVDPERRDLSRPADPEAALGPGRRVMSRSIVPASHLLGGSSGMRPASVSGRRRSSRGFDSLGV